MPNQPKRDADCVFCKIADGHIPSFKIAESERAMAFLDVNPMADGHAIVIPKSHAKDYLDADPEDVAAVALLAQRVARLVDDSKLKPWGFNYVSNQGSIAGQQVFHYHMHVIPKYGKAEGFTQSVGTRYVRKAAEVAEIVGKVKGG